MTTYDPLRAKARVITLTGLGAFLGIALASGLGWIPNDGRTMPTVDEGAAVSASDVQPALDLSEAFTNLADAVTPSVVRIEATRRVPRAQARAIPGIPEQFWREFRFPGDSPPDDQRDQGDALASAVGSGFVVSADGYVLTNTHVVEGAEDVTVWFPDKRSLGATVVGVDPFTDVAVVKVEPEAPLPSMSLGDSDEVRVGEWVLAVGNPGIGTTRRLDFTVTAGIVSARGRPLDLIRRDLYADPRYGDQASRWAIEDFIQTDAVINPGNSGGPMVNLKGQVIGINTAILSTTGAFQGYGFAVPINIARNVMEDIVEYGRVRRPRIGVEIVDATSADADVYGLPAVSGVLVQNVVADGPAEGVLMPEDVIVAIGGETIGYAGELQAAVAEYRPGDEITLTVYREGAPIDLSIRLDEVRIDNISERVAEREVRDEARLGITVAFVSGEEAQELGYDSDGVILTAVMRGSVAERYNAGRFVGWMLVSVNGAEVATPKDVSDALGDVEGNDAVSLRFENADGERRVVNVRMPM